MCRFPISLHTFTYDLYFLKNYLRLPDWFKTKILEYFLQGNTSLYLRLSLYIK